MSSQFSTTIFPWDCKPQLPLDPTTQVQPNFSGLHDAARSAFTEHCFYELGQFESLVCTAGHREPHIYLKRHPQGQLVSVSAQFFIKVFGPHF